MSPQFMCASTVQYIWVSYYSMLGFSRSFFIKIRNSQKEWKKYSLFQQSFFLFPVSQFWRTMKGLRKRVNILSQQPTGSKSNYYCLNPYYERSLGVETSLDTQCGYNTTNTTATFCNNYEILALKKELKKELKKKLKKELKKSLSTQRLLERWNNLEQPGATFQKIREREQDKEVIESLLRIYPRIQITLGNLVANLLA